MAIVMFVLKGLGWIVLALLVLLVGVPLLLLAGWLSWAHFVQSPLYAANYFDGRVEIERVLESRRWHWGSLPWNGGFGCTYAIAALPISASIESPDSWADMWQETPIRIPDGKMNILERCTYLWPKSLVERLNTAASKPGSYYIYGHNTLLLYSSGENVVAKICFGD